MPVGLQTPTNPAQILLALQNLFVTSTLLGPDAWRVECSLERESFVYKGNALFLFPGAQKPEGSIVEGAGRHAPVRRGEFTLRYIGRSLRDAPGIDTYRLTNPDTGTNNDAGLYAMSSSIEGIVATEFLLDATGQYLSVEPIEMTGIPTPSHFGTALEWAGIDVGISVCYVLAMSATNQD